MNYDINAPVPVSTSQSAPEESTRGLSAVFIFIVIFPSEEPACERSTFKRAWDKIWDMQHVKEMHKSQVIFPLIFLAIHIFYIAHHFQSNKHFQIMQKVQKP